jgi:PhnB protein
MPSSYPRLAYQDEVAALEFLVRVFGLVERRESRMEHPDGMLAWLELEDGVVMIGRAGEDRHGLHSPLESGFPTAMVNVYVHDIDEHYRRAEAAGARIVTPLEDMFWGDRRYEALDLDGHRWHFAERLADIRSRQLGSSAGLVSWARQLG